MEKPKGSNSIETKLSRVKARTEMRFLMSCGQIRMLKRERERVEVGKEEELVPMIGSALPSPTMIREGKLGGRGMKGIPEPELMWEEAPLSKTHSP
jgi:hypothetical protein